MGKKVVLITGGTGSFGRKVIKVILEKHPPKKSYHFRLGGIEAIRNVTSLS